MQKIAHKISLRWVEKGIVEYEDSEWFEYALERKLSTAVGIVPFFVLAVLITDFLAAAAFLLCFRMIRTSAGGFHCKSFLGCFFSSLIFELTFLCLLYPVMTPAIMTGTMIICIILIFLLAPYNHPNMALDEREVRACRKKARGMTLLGTMICAAAHFTDLVTAARGAAAGMAMAAFLLCLGYINERRIIRNEKEKSCKEGC